MAECSEESFEAVCGFVGQYALDDLYSVVESVVLEEAVERSYGSGFGVSGSEDHPTHAGVDDQPSTHGARFEGDNEGAVVESPIVDGVAGVSDGGELGVSGGVAPGFAGVGPLAEDDAGDGFVDHCSDGDLAECGCLVGQFEGLAHHRDVNLGGFRHRVGHWF